MAIKKSFNGQTIMKPGAYSKFKIDNSSGSDIGGNDTLFLIGESTKGAPGSVTGIVEFYASRLDALIDTFGAGPLVDVALAAARPSADPQIGGAGRILVYKTNATTQAEADLAKSSDIPFKLKDRAWGAQGNILGAVIASGTTSDQRRVTITTLGGANEELGENPAQVVLSIEYTGDATTATATIAGASRNDLVLTTSLAGDQTDGSVALNIPLAGKTIKQLVDLINAQTGYIASVGTPTLAGSQAIELDLVSALDILTAQDLKKTQIELLNLLNSSLKVEASEEDLVGLPDAQTVALSGGVQGGSTNTDFSNALAVSLAQDYSVVIPCISRDASVDAADAGMGFTDPSSTYTRSAVLAATSAHLALRGSTKNRKEAQGMVAVKEDTKAAAFAAISALNDYNLQAVMEDVVFLDATGNLRAAQPHVFAGLCAGIRLGTSVGEPLTNKYVRAVTVGHKINPTTLMPEGDFNQGLDAEEAIENGVLFAEKRGNGYRIVLDCTTYSDDQSFVYNRGSVIEAAYYVFKDIRKMSEEMFVGKKTSNGIASSVKNAIRNRMREYNAPDVQITASSDHAPEGFVEETFVVTLEGNTLYVQLEFCPVQSLDFLLLSFTLSDIRQTA